MLWFAELGSEDVYWTTLRWKLVAYGLAGVGTAGIVLANLVIAERITVARVRARGDTTARLPRAQRRIAYPLVAIAAGIASAKWQAPGAWTQLALWSGRSDFGATDPLFHRDAGFFVFSLPLYQHVVAWLLASLAMAAAATIAAHVAAGGIRRDGNLVLERGPRAHLLVIGAIALLVVSWRYRLDRYALALPHSDASLPGAGYTDAHVRVPALAALAWLSVVGAGILLAAAAGRLKLLPTAVTIGLALLATAAPGLVSRPLERYVVQPQKLTRERPYVSAAIVATRRAFALDQVASRTSPGSAPPDRRRPRAEPLDGRQRPALGRGRPAAGTGRAPVARSLLPLPEHHARPLYRRRRPTDPHRGRATARSACPGAPTRGAGRNPRFAYTHGYGVTAVRSTEAGEGGHPQFAQTGFGAGANPLGLREPRVYFGEQPAGRPPYVVVASHRAEVDEPAPGSQTRRRTTTTGRAGSGCRACCAAPPSRCASATSISCSPRPSPSARGSCCTATPASACARWPPSCAGTAGRRPWSPTAGSKFVFSGYTTSRSYPYSKPVELGGARINYARAAAHARGRRVQRAR